MKRFCLRIFIVLASVVTFGGTASAWKLDQQWTKIINDGVTYYHFRLNFNDGPVHLYVLELDPSAGYGIRPVIAKDRIGELEQVDSLAKRFGAIAAINGGFFDTQGAHLPVGLIKIDYETIFEQFLPRPVLGIDAYGRVHFETFALRSFLRLSEYQSAIPINGYNRKRKEGDIIAYGRQFGDRTNTNPWGKEIILKRISPRVPQKSKENVLGEDYLIIGEGTGNTAIPEDGIVVSFHSNALKTIRNANIHIYPGAEAEIYTILPEGWERFPHLLGGGPMILKDGKVVLDYRTEKFSKSLNRPAARTAVGNTRGGKILLIVVDRGDKGYSVGATWEQLGIVGQDLLNLTNLMGFDGGGSSTMYIENRVVNRPSGGAPRAVANVLAVVPLSLGK